MAYLDVPKSAVRYCKKYWIVTLLLFISTSISLIYLSVSTGQKPAIVSALIAVTPPALYYAHTEFLSKPAVWLHEKDDKMHVAPMFAPDAQISELNGTEFPVGGEPAELSTDGDGNPVLNVEGAKKAVFDIQGQSVARPAVFYEIGVRNEGRSTAEGARVEIKLDSEYQTQRFYGRWNNPANSETYDLYPGQNHSVLVFKTFITTDFFPTSDLAKYQGGDRVSDDDKKQYAGSISLSFSGNPDGAIKPFRQIKKRHVNPTTYIPREMRPEKSDVSVAGGWEGNELLINRYGSEEFDISARIISNNYKSTWQKVGETNIPTEPMEVARYDRNWQEQWNQPFMQQLQKDILEAVQGSE